ncbi:ABC transporter substrate-binding protein [uncultured Vibrio sp.]|uniref:ABC transporter substrate-binding protein n=1 Tax=uncultured Vibrio sp. TaxID=114054 RepID=UPI00260344F2|nr:ABC transporter substrate-binding protein [uncultured Vibrio sp.]
MIKKCVIALASLLVLWFIVDYEVADKEHTLTIGGPFEFTSQDLSKDGYLYTRMQVAQGLVDVQPNGTFTPLLATRWNKSHDGLQWAFTLRSDVKFHDGSQLTPNVVKHSLEVAMAKPGIINQVPIEQITTTYNTVIIKLSEPYRPLLGILAHFSTAVLSPSSYNSDGSVAKLFGSGPYQTSVIAPPHKLHVTRFDDYWGQPAAIEQAHYLTGHRAESRALQAQSGQADLIYTLDPASLDQLQRSNNLTVHSESIPRTVIIKLNNDHPFLNHADIRQALSLVIDRQGLSQHIIRVPNSEAYELFPPALGDWHLNAESAHSRNLPMAKELLARHGWALNDQQLLERDGETFKLNMVTYADRPELTVLATALQAQFREVGIEVSITVDNSSAIPSRHHDGTLELALIARNFGAIADPLALLLDDFEHHSGGDWGVMNWSSTPLKDLLDRMKSEDNSEAYTLMAQQVAQILADEMPLIPVTFYTQQVSVNNRVVNFVFDPFENNYRISEMTFND